MKRIVLILIISTIFSYNFSQESNTEASKGNLLLTKSDTNEKLRIIIGKDLFRFEGGDSLMNIRVFNRGLNILESLEGPRINFEKYDEPEYMEWKQEYSERERSRRHRNFRGHWSGLGVGFNNFLFAESMVMPDEISYMSLNTNSSNCVNLNISQLSLGITRYFGIVSGIGLNWNNYRFENNNTIVIGPDGIITESTPGGNVPVKKSRLSTLFLNIPAMIELQIPGGSGNHLNIAAGVIGGLKLNAWTKIVFEDGDKLRTNGDFNFNLLRGGATARIGYGNFMVFGTWYLTPWFQEFKGPDGYNLEPFEIGVAFTFND